MSKRNGSYKGCCRMCALRLRGQGDSKVMRHTELAQFGVDRRVSRKGVPDDQMEDLHDQQGDERSSNGAIERDL